MEGTEAKSLTIRQLPPAGKNFLRYRGRTFMLAVCSFCGACQSNFIMWHAAMQQFPSLMLIGACLACIRQVVSALCFSYWPQKSVLCQAM